MNLHRTLAVTMIAMGWAAPALAGGPNPQAKFDLGVAEMEHGHFDVACPAIRESFEIEPLPGTLFALAECEAQWGRCATALARYEEYLAMVPTLSAAGQAKQRGRKKTAQAQITTLRAVTPRLTLMLPKGPSSGVVVTLDGKVLSDASLGVAIPLDPGEHLVTTRVEGAAPSETRVGLARGDIKSILLNVPRPAPVVVPVPGVSLEAGPSGKRVGAFVAGGLGVAGLVVGAVTGGLAISEKSAVNDGCSDLGCTPEGKAAADRLKRFGTASTIGFVLGSAALAVGTVLFVVDRREAKGAPKLALSAGAGGVSVAVEGGF